MKEYRITMYGSIGIKQIDWVENFSSDKWARDWAERTLPYYFPTYTRMVVWYEEEGDVSVVGDFKASVVVTDCA